MVEKGFAPFPASIKPYLELNQSCSGLRSSALSLRDHRGLAFTRLPVLSMGDESQKTTSMGTGQQFSAVSTIYEPNVYIRNVSSLLQYIL